MGHQQLQGILAAPIRGQSGGRIVYQGAGYPARVSPFQVQQVLVNGGFTPMKLATAIVSKSDLPDEVTGDPETAFAAGVLMTAILPGGQSYDCQVYLYDDEITEFKITLWDKSQGA